MIVLQDTGRIALAKALAAMPAYFAWGRGDGAWQGPPAVPIAGQMRDEIGRSLATIVEYVVPATEADYDYMAPEGVGDNILYYKKSAQPSQWLYLQANFGFFDADGETVRECALFFGTTVTPDTPPGHRYITAGQVATPGDMYTMEYRKPSPRERKQETEFLILPL